MFTFMLYYALRQSFVLLFYRQDARERGDGGNAELFLLTYDSAGRSIVKAAVGS